MTTPVDIPRTSFMTFLDTTPTSTATYKLVGEGIEDASLEFNPKTVTKQYINQSSPTTSLVSFDPKFPAKMECKKNDPVYDYVVGLAKAFKTGTDVLSNVVYCWYDDTPTLGEYPAVKFSCAVVAQKYGGKSDENNAFEYEIVGRGTRVLGTFNVSTKVFTPNPNTGEGLSAFTIGALVLTPTFSRDQLFYTATTATTPQTGTATAEDPTATVLLKNGLTIIDTDTGEATGSITLALGVNTITAKVTIGTTNNTYTIAVTKTA
jgi:hypothetical protein